MQLNKARVLAAVVVATLLLLLLILWLCLGITKAFFIFAGIDSAAILAILAILVWDLLRQYSPLDRRLSMARRKAMVGEHIRLEYSFLRKVAGLPSQFRCEQLEAATDNFRAVLGRGASASVFKGILDDGTAVAVKRIEGTDHGDRVFRAEVTAIAAVQHVNLVRLLGYCFVPGPGHRYLVYEYIHNGSLDNWIFPDDRAGGQQRCLPWARRYQVAVDVAKALAYLHHDCRARILHLDVKPENILLDEALRARVTDFGLSKLMGKDESRVVTTVRGTHGYLAPEWLLDAGVTEKSDIYSYGMVVLEIVGGRRNLRLVGEGPASQRRWSYFPRIVAEKLREGKIMEVVDGRLLSSPPASGRHYPGGEVGGSSGAPHISGQVEEEEVRVLVQVALWCIQEKAELRPTMARVVDMLERRLPVEAPPETEMILVDLLNIDQSMSSPRRLEPQNPAMSYSIPTSSMSPR